MRNFSICPEAPIRHSLVRLIAAGLAALVSVNVACAIDPNRAMSQYVVDRWSAEQGFSRGVYSIGQDADGYLMVATRSGLLRFDGQSFVQMHAMDVDPLFGRVVSLVTDAQGILWLRLSAAGLTMLRYEHAAFRNVIADLPNTAAADAITRGRDGVAVCLLNFGTLSVRGRREEVIVPCGRMSEAGIPCKGCPQSAVLAFAQTANGDFWLGTTDEGLFRVRDGRAEPVSEGLPDRKVNALAPGANGELWVGTDAGIVRWDGAKLTRAGIPDSLRGLQVLAILADRDSNVWLGTNSRGLLRLNGHGVSELAGPDLGTSEAISAVFEDREGALWAGGGAGLMRLRDSPFLSYSRSEGVPSGGGGPVFADSAGRTWLAPAGGGLVWLRDEQRGRLSDDGIDRDLVYSIAGRNGDLWIGRQHGGLTHLRSQGATFRSVTFKEANGLAQNSVYSVYEARDGTVWAGTLSGGVSRIANGRLTTFSTANGLISNTVNAIIESPDGTMWFATPEGISMFSEGRWQNFNASSGLPSAEANCLLVDSGGVLWTGTAAGLAFRTASGFTAPRGTPASLLEPIFGLAEDRLGWLWVATASHVLRVNRAKLQQGSLAEGDVREYGLADGLRSVEGVKRDRSVVVDFSGRIWFSLNGEIAAVDPARLGNQAALAIPNIQAVWVDGKPLSMGGGAHISGRAQRITFEYVGLGLSAPDRVRFRHVLEGFDPHWEESVGTRQTSYTNLPHAQYRFRVTAANPDGVWSARDASFTFEVDPLYWQTWWFRLSLLAGSAVVILALHHFRVAWVARQLNMRFEERVGERIRIARDLHDTLLQSFQAVLMKFSMLECMIRDRPDEAEQLLHRTIDQARQALRECRDAVQGLRSSTVQGNDLARSVTAVAQGLAADQTNQNGPEFRVVVEGKSRDLPPIVRDEVYHIACESLRNAFRHARARRIEVLIRYDQRQFQLRVVDNGKGIDQPVLNARGRPGHHGLPGMSERARLAGGKLSVLSRLDSGTEINLTIPASIAYTTSPSALRSMSSGEGRA